MVGLFYTLTKNISTLGLKKKRPNGTATKSPPVAGGLNTCVSDVLALRKEDAETILYNLGFAIEESNRIPDRFFTCSSKAAGIDFKLFIDCQMHRLKEEDFIY
uniref:ITPR-interacting domain-containing protein n=1 Tax=Leptobrachium leishanense TaxID=445787 RepID=A0A8C5M6P5_9ANUR